MPNIIMADQPNGTKLSGNWGEIYHEQVTVGTNSVTNVKAAFNLIIGSRFDNSGTVFAIRRVSSESPNPAADEFGGVFVKSTPAITPIRFRGGHWVESGFTSEYDAVISNGSVFDVLSMKYNSL